jgi:hypothetical protein
MNKTEYNIRLRSEVDVLKHQYRNDNSAFLIWFLKNIFCLSEQESVDSVCDGRRDKGIDGIWVDENDEEIYIFQSEFSPNNDRDAGDSKIKEFSGTSTWFANETQVKKLLVALINLELSQRLISLRIADKVSRGYTVNYVYVTNKIFDINATEYLDTTDIDAYDNNIIFGKYTYMVEDDILNTPKTLELSNSTAIIYNSAIDNFSIVLAIPVNQLLKLDGIQDHTLFSRNVRLWTGKTRVNKELANTIKDNSEHDNFFLYHNGISITCSDFDFDSSNNKIEISGYQVINGCQSLISFYQNSTNLSDRMLVLTKIIKVEPQSTLIQKITKNANNQNAISPKDLKSNDRVQISLQRNFFKVFDNKVLYMIKRGESTIGYDDVIDIDYAGQLIKSFYFDEPYKTHLKTSFYGDEYENLFSRKMNSQKIYLAYIIHKIIIENIDSIENVPARNYGLAKFAILRIIKSIIYDDLLGAEIIENPNNYVIEPIKSNLIGAVKKLFELVALDINGFIADYIPTVELFDYKNLFKNKEFCDKINTAVLISHKKSVVRHPEDSFKAIFESLTTTE